MLDEEKSYQSNALEKVRLDYILKKSKFVIKHKKLITSTTPLLSYVILTFVPMIILIFSTPVGKLMLPDKNSQTMPPLQNAFFFLMISALFAVSALFVSNTLVKRFVINWTNKFQTKIEKDYITMLRDDIKTLNQKEKKLHKFINYVEMVHNKMAIDEAERIATGEDEKMRERMLENFPLRIWLTFENEVHNTGLTHSTKKFMKEHFDIDISIGYKLDTNHTHRVTKYAAILIKELGLIEKVNKPEQLTNEKQLYWLQHQTEWFDGSGYPEGLKGGDTPMLSRITAVAEAFDIFYQCWKDIDKAIDAINKFSGTKFDPQIVAILKKSCIEKRIP